MTKIAPKTVRIRYFALLREERGLSDESYETEAETALDLYEELAGTYGLSLPANMVSVAINDRMTDPRARLDDNDQVVFLPPVAGG